MVTGVSTNMRKMPSRKPTTIAARQPLALSRLEDAEEEDDEDRRGQVALHGLQVVVQAVRPLMTGIQARAMSTIMAVAMRPDAHQLVLRCAWGCHFS